MSDDAPAIDWFGPRVLFFENALAAVETEHDRDKTLFVQLTKHELTTIQFGLMWLNRIYGAEATAELTEKLFELVDVQGFCDCPRCQAERKARKEEK